MFMQENKKFYRKTIIIAIMITIISSASYFYFAEYLTDKIDSLAGIPELQIKKGEITKIYDIKNDNIILMITYFTNKNSTSYIKINSLISESTYGTSFLKKVVLEKSLEGKPVKLKIIAIDEFGEKTEYEEEVMLPQKIEPIITITQ